MWDMTARSIGPAQIRGYSSGGSRGTVSSMNYSPLFQEMSGTMFSGETRQQIEHFEPYGWTSAIKPQDENGVAEALMSHVTGARAHAVAGVIGDRRYRLLNLKSGEVAQYDDQTQQRHISRGGVYDSVPNRMLHQERVQKSGDQVTAAGADGQGQSAWQPKTPSSYKHHDAKVQQNQHPMQVNHQIIQGDAMPPSGSNGAGSISDISSQLSGAMSQLSSLVSSASGLPGVNDLASTMQTLTSMIPTAPGTTPAINDLATMVAPLVSSLSSAGSMTGLSSIVAQVQPLISQISGMAGGGASSIIHNHLLDMAKGILHGAFMNQHTTTWDQKGVTSTSSAKVTSQAPQIPHNGQVYNSDNTFTTQNDYAAAFPFICDGRLKTNIADHPPVLDKLLAIKIKTFDKRKIAYVDGEASIHGDAATPSLGVIAQDIREVFPSLVHDACGFLAVDVAGLAILAIKALQEQQQQIDELRRSRETV